MTRQYSMGRRAATIERTRTRIETSLITLLATEPYAAIAMPDIAKEARVSVRTVQRHYRSKDGLLVDACVRGSLSALSEELSKDTPAQSVEERIRSLVQTLFAFYDQHDRECWALHSRAAEAPEVQQAVGYGNEMRASHIRRFIDRRPDAWCVDGESAKQVILALTSYPAWRAFNEFTDFPTPEAATFVADLLCESLVRQSDFPRG